MSVIDHNMKNSENMSNVIEFSRTLKDTRSKLSVALKEAGTAFANLRKSASEFLIQSQMLEDLIMREQKPQQQTLEE